MNEQQKIVNEIFKSIDIITDKKIQDTSYSMSITGQIIERIKGSDMYKINYQNEEIRAQSLGGSYTQGDTVIILMPDKRMDSLKFILGRANDRTPTISVSQTGELSADVLAEMQRALEVINDIASDDKITASEKTTLAIQWENLKVSYNDLLSRLATEYQTIDPYMLQSYYAALDTVMDQILGDMSTTIDYAGSTLRRLFSEYYQEDQSVRSRIVEFINSQKTYKVEISSSNGSQFINGNINTTLIAKVYKGLYEVTATLPVESFVWKKVNHLGATDSEWNTANAGTGSEVEITSEDMLGKAVFNCEIHLDSAIVATGQLTLVDLSDTRSIQAFIASSQPFVQIYDKDSATYVPNWKLTPPTLTPSMYVSGSTADIIDSALSVEWYKDNVLITDTTPNHSIVNNRLTINENILSSANFVNYRVMVSYEDNSTGLIISDSDSVEFSKLINGSSGSDGTDGTNGDNAQLAYLLYPDGTVFKNDALHVMKRLEVKYFDGIYEQTTNLNVKWFYADPTVTTSSPNYDPDGGVGWSRISQTNNGNGSYHNYTTKILSVARNGVDGTETFKAMVQHGSKPFYSAIGTLVDIFDPHQVVIEGDTTFKNGVGILQLAARVFLNGEELEDFTGYSFLWTAYSSDGTVVSTFNKNTQFVSVSVDEVPDQGYLACDIFKA